MADRVPPTLTVRLRLTFGLLLGFVVIVGIAGIVALVVVDRSAAEVGDRLDPLVTDNQQATEQMSSAQGAMRGYVLSGNPTLSHDFDEASAAFGRSLARLRAEEGGDDELTKLVEAEDATGSAWLDGFARPTVEQRATDPAGAQSRIGSNEGIADFAAFRAASAATSQYLEARRSDARSRIASVTVAAGVAILLLVASSIWAGLVLARRTSGFITRPLEKLRATLSRLQQGDFSQRVDVEGPDEIRAVAEDVNAVAAETERLTTIQRRRMEREQMIRDVSRTIREYLDVDAVLNLASRELVAALDVDRVAVLTVEHNALGPIVAEWAGAQARTLGVGNAELLPPGLARVAQPVFDLGQALAVDDITSDRRLDDRARDVFRQQRVRAWIMAPVYATDDLIALLFIQVLNRPRSWSATDIGIVESVAREMGVALSHARLFERERSMVAQLQKLDQAKNDFVSSVSHELRTPLTSIVGYVEMLKEGEAEPLNDEQAQMLAVIERNSARLLVLIDDLLTLSKLESGGLDVPFDEVDVETLVTGACQAIAPILKGRSIALDVELEPALPRVWGDAGQLERVLLNLLTNAIKFTPDGGRITLTAVANPEVVTFAMDDTGIGIPEDEQEKLFTRFFRSSRAQDQAIQGTGLGLVIVKSIIEKHRGTVSFSSTPGQGTSIVFTVPVAQLWGVSRGPVAAVGEAAD